MLAGFTLQEVGGPPIDERPDATGLFADGRFLDFSDVKNRSDRPGNFQNRQQNRLHSMSVTDDGERVYVAGTTAGFYVLDTEAIAHHKDAELAAGTAGCNTRSTIVAVDGVIDASRLAAAGQRLHPHGGEQRPRAEGVPGVQRLRRGQDRTVSGAVDAFAVRHVSPDQRDADRHAQRRLRPRPAGAGQGNTKARPAYVWFTDENGGCPLNYARMLSVESEITPIMIGAFAIPDNQMEQCLDQANTEPNGARRRQVAQQNHNPTVFKNIVFNTWYGHGLRAIDISIPMMPREVGHALPVPKGSPEPTRSSRTA